MSVKNAGAHVCSFLGEFLHGELTVASTLTPQVEAAF